jgi:Fic family protein
MSFQPKFTWVNTPAECAYLINKPHEDFPKRVNATESVLVTLIKNQTDLITSFHARQIHSILFAGESFAGKWRNCDVRIGKDFPPSHLQVPALIEKIFPVSQGRFNLPDWYKEFQEIHPFADGNGRVGGCAVAILSWDGVKMLAPLQ